MPKPPPVTDIRDAAKLLADRGAGLPHRGCGSPDAPLLRRDDGRCSRWEAVHRRPQLPEWLERIEIIGMRVGTARLDLTFTSRDGVTAAQVPRKEGDIEVLIRH